MPDERERRLALNESAFRVANERMKDWPERQQQDEPSLYHCECSDLACRERIPLTIGMYEHVRSDSRHFAVVPGHEVPDIETIVERGEGYLIVEKMAGTTPLVEATDPRT
jgi:hypothetical protein